MTWPLKRPLLILLVLLLPLLALGGCSFAEAMNRPVEIEQAQREADRVAQALESLKGYIAGLREQIARAEATIQDQDARLVEARALAEQSRSEAAIALVRGLEQARTVALSAAQGLQSTLTTAEQHLPTLEKLTAEAQESLAKLKEQGPSSPLWYVLGTLLLPVAVKGAQVGLAGVPGVGPLLASIVEPAAVGLWNTLATPRQKAADAEAEAKAKALEYQVDVTHGLLSLEGLPKGVEELLRTEKAKQTRDGVRDVIAPLVAAREAKG